LTQKEYVAHGLQLWAALPKAYEETTPEFTHTPATAIPEWSAPRIRVRVLVGNAFGLRSPVATYCETLYLDVVAQSGGTLVLPPPKDVGFEHAIYSVDEPLQVDGDAVPPFSMAVLAPGAGATIEAPRGARYVVIGGEPLDASRTIWWNFVSTRRERIEQAKADWAAQRMGKIAGEHEWIPLP
jgi:redox-sensitive bicupin YhaK (pirin superfamily)